MARGCNGWYHVTGNTYGTWLRSDPLGWRERHHRRHVEGDYKHLPAAGTGADEWALSKALMDREAVRLDRSLRSVALLGIVTTLADWGAPVVIASLDDHHLHVLARIPDHDCRRSMGWAKLAATKQVKKTLVALKARGIAV